MVLLITAKCVQNREFLGLLIMIENLLLIVTVFTNKTFHTTTFVYIANLAVADALAGIMFMFMYAGGLEFDAAHETVWFLKYGGTIVSLTASLCSLLSVAVDRCVELSTLSVHSHLGDPKRRLRCIVAVLLTWLVSMAIGFAPILGWNWFLFFPRLAPVAGSSRHLAFVACFPAFGTGFRFFSRLALADIFQPFLRERFCVFILTQDKYGDVVLF